MKNFITYLSTAPVLVILSTSFVASLLIEINRFFPDALIFSFLKNYLEVHILSIF